LEFKADFHLQMRVGRQELGAGLNPKPPAIPTLTLTYKVLST